VVERAAEIQDTRLRDLLLSQVAHRAGLDGCEAIQDRPLRQACLVRARRPHLDIPEPSQAGDQPSRPPEISQGARSAAQNCERRSPGLLDACLLSRSIRADPLEAGSLCQAMVDEANRGDCLAQLATRLGAAGEATQGSSLCQGAPAGLWHAECFFRLAEELPLAALPAKVQACSSAGRFADECLRHLLQQQASAGSLRARFGSLQETLLGMEQDRDELLGLLPDPGLLPRRERLFWYEGFHALLAEAAQRDQLGPITSQGLSLLRDDPRGLWWWDCALQLCVRSQLQQRSGTGDPLGLSGLLALCPDPVAAQGPLPTPAFASPSAPPERLAKLAISEVPAVLEPTAGCTLDAVGRQSVLALWGLEVLPWAVSRLALEQALVHSQLPVRAYALDMAEHKAFYWERDDHQGWSWLAGQLRSVADSDPHPALRARAALLEEGLAQGQRPARWALEAEAVCRER